MKNNAITRIIIFSIVIVILLGILLTGLGIGMFMIDFPQGSSEYTTTQDAAASVSPADIRNIRIEWAAGSIDIQTADTDTITFSESGSYTEDMQMVWKQTGDTLTICYSKPVLRFGFFSYANKDLTVTIPKDWDCRKLSLDVASAELTVQDLKADTVDMDTASGSCEFISCDIKDLDVDTASGAIYYEGRLNTLDCDAASACFEGILTNTPSSIQMDSASGDLELTLPEDCGFRVTMDALSGKFHSDFPANYDYNKECYIYGDERCDIDFDGASGSVTIQKAE